MKPHPREMKTGRTLETWDSWIDEAIKNARERGDFDNLQAQGKPIKVESNPLAGDAELGYHVLKNNDMLPHWMELGKDVAQARDDLDSFLDHAASRLARLRERACAAADNMASPPKSARWQRFLFGSQGAANSGDHVPSVASVEQERLVTRRQYLQRAAEVDKRTVEFNSALSDDIRWLERPRLIPQQAEEKFDAACPPIRCDNARSS